MEETKSDFDGSLDDAGSVEVEDLDVGLRRAERQIGDGKYGKAMKLIGELKLSFPEDVRPWLMDVKLRLARGGNLTTVLKQCQEIEDIFGGDAEIAKNLEEFRKITYNLLKEDGAAVSVKALPKISPSGTDVGNVRIRKKAGASSVVFVFAGVGEGEKIYAKLRPILDGLSAHYVLLSDPTQMVGIGGYEGLGNSFDETVEGLKKIVADLSAKQVVCLGHSAGGYAAIRYGLRLEATHIIVSAAPTEFTRDALKWDKRMKILAARIARRFGGDFGERLADFIRDYQKPVKITHFYGGSMPEDARHAANLKGLPSVELRRIEGIDVHGIITQLIEDGSIEKCLDEALQDGASPAAS